MQKKKCRKKKKKKKQKKKKKKKKKKNKTKKNSKNVLAHSNRTVINKNTPKPTEKSHRFQYFVFFLFKIPCIL